MKARPHRRGLYAPELLEARIAPATFTVTSLLDNGDGDKLTLREAVAAANAAPGADTILFKIPVANLPGTINLGAGGEILISDTITITGPGIDLLALSGGDLARIFKITDGTAVLKPTTISGLTLTDGKTAANGGALYSAEPLTFKNVVVRSSYAAADGGGIFVKTAGKISITSSQIVHNEADDDSGGLYLRGDAGITIVKTTVADNTALTRAGLYARADGAKSAILIDTCVIANNSATFGTGGGLQLSGVGDGKVTVKNSLITGNTSTSGGGGLFVDDGNLVVTNTTFSNNTSSVGGGIFADSVKAVTISGSRFTGNAATDGGGVGAGALFVEGALNGTSVKITSSSFVRNSSASDGGVFSHTDQVALTISGSSFLGNTAADDGGVFALGDKVSLTLKSSILSGNAAGAAAGNNGGVIFVHTATGMIFPTTPTLLTLTGNKFTDNSARDGGAIFMEGTGVAAGFATLSGNLFQANLAVEEGGAIHARESSQVISKSDKFIGNVARGQGGGIYLVNTGGITVTSAIIQANAAGSSGGGGVIAGTATLTSLKVLDNIAGSGGRGGGLRLAGAVVLSKSIVTGNVANDGGGVFYTMGTTSILSTVIKNNAALINPNIGKA